MHDRRHTTRPLLLIFAMAAVVLTTLIATPPRPAQAVTVTITETFKNATAPNWTLQGSAALTGNGTIDPVGDGWLRLTDATNEIAGSAIYNQAFSSSDGIQVSFEYATYGGTGADGFSFYLIDGATATPTVGAPGGALGYAQRTLPPIPTEPGVTNGYIGIGFDEFGNYAAAETGGCNIPCSVSPDTVSIRGSGSLATVGDFKLLAKAPLSPRSIDDVARSSPRKVRITILNQVITVAIDFGSGFENVISGFDLSTVPGQAATPATFKMGFSGATGGSTNYHEIRSLTVGGAQASAATLTSSLNPAPEGQAVTFSTTVSGSQVTPTGTVTFKDGTTTIGTATLNASGQAQLTTSALTNGTHPITAVYEGDNIYGSSTSPVVSQVIIGPDLAISQTYQIQFVNQVTYTITARNLGPSSADGAVITNVFPTPLSGVSWTWTCVGAGGAACGAASGTGNLNQTLGAFPVNGSVVYTVTGQIG
ncbi:MAG: DUF11 domain-containing protein, partial [Chloroflexales bacterium]|nr:DUF11 domain-containing protein [Chloroflexales bacterium]